MLPIVSPQQGGTSTVEISYKSSTPTISETPLATLNQSNPIFQGLPLRASQQIVVIQLLKGMYLIKENQEVIQTQLLMLILVVATYRHL